MLRRGELFSHFVRFQGQQQITFLDRLAVCCGFLTTKVETTLGLSITSSNLTASKTPSIFNSSRSGSSAILCVAGAAFSEAEGAARAGGTAAFSAGISWAAAPAAARQAIPTQARKLQVSWCFSPQKPRHTEMGKGQPSTSIILPNRKRTPRRKDPGRNSELRSRT